MIELRDHDRVSTRIGNHADATVPAVARRVNPELRDRAGQRGRIAPRMGAPISDLLAGARRGALLRRICVASDPARLIVRCPAGGWCR